MQVAVTHGNGPGARSVITYTTADIEKVLSKVRRTLPGNDDMWSTIQFDKLLVITNQ